MLIFTVTDKPKEQAAEVLSSWLVEYKERPTLLLLSGGSAFSFLDSVDVPAISKLWVGVLDERFTVDPQINNLLQLSKTEFLEKILAAGNQNLSPEIQEGESLNAFADRCNEALTNWLHLYPEGVVCATMGIGVDGHTAGILPLPSEKNTFENLFNVTGRLVVGYTAPEGSTPYRERITVTLPFLRERINRALVFVKGEEKREILQSLLRGTNPLHKHPMMVFKDMKDVLVVTDIDS